MNRASFLAASSLTVAGLTRAASAATPISLRAGAIAIDSDGLPFYAQSFNYFARNGLNVDVQPMSTGDAAAAAIVAGSLDFGSINTVSLALAHQNGIPLKIIGGGQVYATASPTTQLMVLKESPIKTADDLNGKVVAVNVLKGVAHIAAQAWIDDNHGNAKAVKFAEMPFSVMGDALKAGRVDAAVMAEPGLTFAKRSTSRVLANCYDGFGKAWMVDMYVATDAWIAAHPNETQLIALSLRQAAAFANANPKKTEARLVEISKASPETVAMITRCKYAERVEPALIQPVIDVSARYGVLTKSFPVSELLPPRS